MDPRKEEIMHLQAYSDTTCMSGDVRFCIHVIQHDAEEVPSRLEKQVWTHSSIT